MRFLTYLAAALPVFVSIPAVLAGTTPEEVQADLVDLSRRSNTIGAFSKLVTDENAEDMGQRILTAINRLNDVFGHSRGRLQKADHYGPGDDADKIMDSYFHLSDKLILAMDHLKQAHEPLHAFDEKAIGKALEDLYGSVLMYNREMYCVISKAATVDSVRAQTNTELAVASAAQEYCHGDDGDDKDVLFTQKPRRDHARRIQWRVEF